MSENKNIPPDSIYKDMEEEILANFNANEKTKISELRKQKLQNILQADYDDTTIIFLINKYHDEKTALEKELHEKKSAHTANDRQRIVSGRRHHDQLAAEQKIAEEILLKNLYSQKDYLEIEINNIKFEIEDTKTKIKSFEKEIKELKTKDIDLAHDLSKVLRTNYQEISQSNKSSIKVDLPQIKKEDLIGKNKPEPLSIKLSDIAKRFAETIPNDIDNLNLSASQIHEAEERMIKQCGRESLVEYYKKLVKPSEVDHYVSLAENSKEYQDALKEGLANIRASAELQNSANPLKEALDKKCKNESDITKKEIAIEQEQIVLKSLEKKESELNKEYHVVNSAIKGMEKGNISVGNQQNYPSDNKKQDNLSSMSEKIAVAPESKSSSRNKEDPNEEIAQRTFRK